MNLLNQIVVHRVFGEGVITGQNDNYFSVTFSQGEKKFIFPDSFDSYLKAKDSTVAVEVEKHLERWHEEKQRAQQVKESQLKQIQERLSYAKDHTPTATKKKLYPRANIAFKCNFCDGGQSDIQIGYDGICSDPVIYNNIKVENRTWCNSDESACRKYLIGEITRQELDALCKDDGFVCYESQMLRNWKALAGIVQTGENKGKPMRLNQVQPNSLCILTTRDPESTESERYIFAAFLVDETYEGDGKDEGYVTTRSEYKIKLTPKEARKAHILELSC